MNGRRILMLMAIAAGALAVAASAAAQGGTVKIDSTISIKEKSSLHFSGKVRADNPNCVEQRKVILRKVVEGGKDEKVGSDKTDSNGKWSIEPQGSAGISMASFYAKAKKVKQGTAGTIYVCKGARSQTISPGSG